MKKYLDDSWLKDQHKLYLAGKSTTAIARAGGCGRSTVYARFRELGLEVRPLSEGRKMGGRPYIADADDPVEDGVVGLLRSQWQYVEKLGKNRSEVMRQIVDAHREK